MPVELYKVQDLAGLEQFPKVHAPSINRSKMRRQHFLLPAVTVAGDAGSSIDLALLPAGAVRLCLATSRIYWSAFGAGRVMDIGHRQYEDIGGNVVPAVQDLFDAAVDVAAAGNAPLGSSFVPSAGTLVPTNRFLSARGVLLSATVTGGTIPVGAIVEGWVDYSEI